MAETTNKPDPTLQTLIDTYVEADKQYQESRERRTKSRQMARGLREVGIGSPEQQAWVDENLPVRERNTSGDAGTE